MKRRRLGTMLATVFGLLLVSPIAGAEEVTLASCKPDGGSGDNLGRAFYFPGFPGNNLAQVTMGFNGAPGGYVFTLTAHANTFDGPQIGAAQGTAAIAPAATSLVTFDFAGAPVVPGSTIAFTVSATSDAGIVSIFQVTGTAPCPVVETNDSTPPLSTFRRESMGVIITTRAPTVTSLAPTQGPPDGGTVVTITGTHLLAGATVSFGDASAPIVAVDDGGASAQVMTPPNPVGLVDVSVETAYTNDAGVDASATSLFDGGFNYVIVSSVDSGASSSSGGTSGSSASSGGASGTSGGPSNGGGTSDAGQDAFPAADEGCGCTVPGGPAPPFATLFAAAAAAALRALRRRRR
jgi:MYXO-CTERM domain-containing protein